MTTQKAPAGRMGWYLGALGVLLASALAFTLLYECLFPVLLGFALAYAFDPLADWLEARGLGRTAAVCVIMAFVLGGSALAAALVLPGLIEQSREFAGRLPDYVHTAVGRLGAWAGRWGIPMPRNEAELLGRLKGWLQGLSLGAVLPVGRVMGRFFSSAASMVVGLLNLVVVPVVFFYFLRDIDAMRVSFIELFPPRLRDAASLRLGQAERVFSGYIRGQILVALILAFLYSAGLALVGIPFGVVIGVAAGLLNIVPYVGVFTGLALSLVMAVVQFEGLWPFVGVALVFSLCQLLEGFVITPRVVGDRVGLGTPETVVALIVGGELGGLWGLVLAIPAAGILKVYLIDAVAAYRRSDFYAA